MIWKRVTRIDWTPFAVLLFVIGLLIFLTGGVNLEGVIAGRKIQVSVDRWALFFIPVLMIRQIWPHFASDRWIRSSAVWFLFFFVFLTYCGAAWNRVFSFQAGWDLAIYSNACSNHLHSSLRDHTSLMADHFEPILFLFQWGCRLTSPQLFLLTVQALAGAAAATGIYQLVIHLEGGVARAFLLGLLYACGNAFSAALLWDFHPYSLALMNIPWMLFFVLTDRWVFLMIGVLLHLSLKEHTGLMIGGMGLALAFSMPRHRWRYLLLGIFGYIVFIFVMKFAFPFFRDGRESFYFEKYYGYLGRSMSEFVVNGIIKPHLVLQKLLDWDVIRYSGVLLLCFCLVLTRIVLLLPIVPVFMSNVLSTTPFLYSGRFHYDCEIYAWLFCVCLVLYFNPALLKVKHLRLFNLQRNHFKLIAAVSFLAFYTGRSPVAVMNKYRPSDVDLDLYSEIQRLVPKLKSCRVATNDQLAAALAELPHVTLMDDVRKADTLVVAYPRGHRLWKNRLKEIEGSIVPQWAKVSTVWRPIDADQDFRIFSKCEEFNRQMALN